MLIIKSVNKQVAKHCDIVVASFIRDPYDGWGPQEVAWLILSSDLSQGVSQVEMQSAPCVCISEKVSTDRTQTLLPCLLAMPLTKESQRTSLAAKTEISLGSVASTALTTLHLPMYSM